MYWGNRGAFAWRASGFSTSRAFGVAAPDCVAEKSTGGWQILCFRHKAGNRVSLTTFYWQMDSY